MPVRAYATCRCGQVTFTLAIMKPPISLVLPLFAAIAISSGVFAQDVWRTPQGAVAAESASRKAVDGLGVLVLVTDDPDWGAKWNTPSTNIPNFNETKVVTTGGSLSILTFVANPKAAAPSGNLNVVSHIRLWRPDGSLSVDAPNQPCLRGRLQGPAANTRLCEAVVGFRADPGDQAGKWKVRVIVTDNNRPVTVPVESTFVLDAK